MALRSFIRVLYREGKNALYHLHLWLTILQFEDKAFRLLVDTYVTEADGTGIVHQAPAFGEDDHRICLENGVLRPDEMPPCPIDDSGRFTDEVPDFAGQYVKVRDSGRYRCKP